MKKIFCLTIMSFLSTASFAADKDTQTIEQKLNSLKLEKMQAEFMINTMAKRGRFNDEEASAAKREIASIQEEDVTTMKTKALEKLDSKNSFATK